MARPPFPFGDLLKRYRAAAGLAQDELAGWAGLSARAISDLERGIKQHPHAGTAQLTKPKAGVGTVAPSLSSRGVPPPPAPVQARDPGGSQPLPGGGDSVPPAVDGAAVPTGRLRGSATNPGNAGQTLPALDPLPGEHYAYDRRLCNRMPLPPSSTRESLSVEAR